MKIMNSKNIILESDLGHDPDDCFAICYLQSVGVNIRAIVVAEGDPHQVTLAKMFCKEFGLDIPVGAVSLERADPKVYEGSFEGADVQSYVDFHHRLLKHYGYSSYQKADGLGYEIIKETYSKYPDSEFFIIGPAKNTGKFIDVYGESLRNCPIKQVTFQGGFLGYDLHKYPCKRLPKFAGKVTCPTWNLNGAIKQTQSIIDCPHIDNIRFISKNVCHGIIYDKNIHDLVKAVDTKNRADEMFLKGMDMYLERHPEKKFHDPCAAVCMLHPEIANWVRGKMYYDGKNGWGTKPDLNCNSETIAHIDEDRFWELILDKE